MKAGNTVLLKVKKMIIILVDKLINKLNKSYELTCCKSLLLDDFIHILYLTKWQTEVHYNDACFAMLASYVILRFPSVKIKLSSIILSK